MATITSYTKDEIDALLAALGSSGVIGVSSGVGPTTTPDSNGFEWNDWTFTEESGASLVLAETSSGSETFEPADAGWYIAQGDFYLVIDGTASVPGYVRMDLNTLSDDTRMYASEHAIFITDGSQKFIGKTVTSKPFYHPGVGVGDNFLNARVVLPTTSGVVWTSRSIKYWLSRIA